MEKITSVLWFDKDGEEAANFYVSLLPDSHIDGVMKAPAENLSSAEGATLVVYFTLAGRSYSALNGGPHFKPNEAVSFMIVTEDQDETDRLWNAIVDNGGTESMCGWCKDRWGFSWQITPRRHLELVSGDDPERARRAFEAMMKMKKIDIAAIEAAVAGEPASA